MIPATKRIHHGLFVAKSFTSSFKDVFSSLIGFTRSFVHEKVRKNIIAANMAKTTAAICQPNACDGTPSTIFILLNISTNGSIRNNTKILPPNAKVIRYEDNDVRACGSGDITPNNEAYGTLTNEYTIIMSV